jgi:hypothetical protein
VTWAESSLQPHESAAEMAANPEIKNIQPRQLSFASMQNLLKRETKAKAPQDFTTAGREFWCYKLLVLNSCRRYQNNRMRQHTHFHDEAQSSCSLSEQLAIYLW